MYVVYRYMGTVCEDNLIISKRINCATKSPNIGVKKVLPNLFPMALLF